MAADNLNLSYIKWKYNSNQQIIYATSTIKIIPTRWIPRIQVGFLLIILFFDTLKCVLCVQKYTLSRILVSKWYHAYYADQAANMILLYISSDTTF